LEGLLTIEVVEERCWDWYHIAADEEVDSEDYEILAKLRGS
jgi:hypothetical protein